MLTRKSTRPYKVPDSDLVLEKGIRVIIPSYAINRDPELYPDPLRFDPERFNPATTKERHTVNLQFGDGPMTCIGKLVWTIISAKGDTQGSNND